MNSSNGVTTFHQSGDGMVWQPVTMVPIKEDASKPKYPGMPTIVINFFSAICIFLGIASIGVQIAALVIYATSISNYVWFAADVSGYGIWAGSFYVIAGSLGIASTYKRTKLLMVWTVVFSALSIASSIVASALSGIAASDGFSYNCYASYHYDLCEAWMALEWSLLGISVLASLSSITLVVITSIAVCCSRRRNNIAGIQQGVHFGAAVGHQPMYFTPQPMQLSGQQQYQPYQPNFQPSYVPQQIQQQLQMPFISASTAQQPAQMQSAASIPIPQQQQPSGSEADVKVRAAE